MAQGQVHNNARTAGVVAAKAVEGVAGGSQLRTLVEPLRLLLLADASPWRALLETRLATLGMATSLSCAPSWAAASGVLEAGAAALVLTTPECLPPAGSCPWPLILLLEHEPAEPPCGVSDWLSRDELSDAVLRRVLRYGRDYAALQAAVTRLAEQDALTGIANSQGFRALLAMRLAERGGLGLTLGHLDLDNFSHANDALGHQGGDRLILQVVARLRSQLEPGDSLARLGGDEFALLLDTRQDSSRAERLAERITRVLAEPYWVEGESLLLGCSLGLTRVGRLAEVDTLLWQAQVAMQQAKRQPGCTFCQFDERLSRGARDLADREGELRQALRGEELALHYQPRLCLKTGEIVGLEALVRWHHRERGLLTPDEFVPLAEESGLIVPLGYWVISRALRDMQWLRGRGLERLHMAVNLSFRQFQDSQLLPTLQRLIDERDVDGHWLEFELTETAVMRRSDQVRLTMDELGELGVRFSLDDFGTGFSSFVHLSSLPITLLKIDRSFVAQMQPGSEGAQLVSAMISMAHNLRLDVVAEGVESSAQLDQLRRFGCDQVQGYLISRPLPLPALADYLRLRQPQALLSV